MDQYVLLINQGHKEETAKHLIPPRIDGWIFLYFMQMHIHRPHDLNSTRYVYYR